MSVRRLLLSIVLLSLILAPKAQNEPQPKRTNLARLAEKFPGSARALGWTDDKTTRDLPALADGYTTTAVAMAGGLKAVGVEWAVPHGMDGATVYYDSEPPTPDSVRLEVHDGAEWIPVRQGLKIERSAGRNALIFSFEPLATRRIRIPAQDHALICELEIYQYAPGQEGIFHVGEAPTVGWPERVIKDNLLEQDLLKQPEEPSFERLSLYGLSIPAWAMMGLKDAKHEEAVNAGGEIYAFKRRYYLTLGDPPRRLSDARDTLRRTLVDGWLPAIIVDGQIGQSRIRQTSFVTTIGAGDEKTPEKSALFVRIEVENSGDQELQTVLRFHAKQDREAVLTFKDGALYPSQAPWLIAPDAHADKQPNAVAVDLALKPNEHRTMDLIIPLYGAPEAATELRSAEFETMLNKMRQDWEQQLASAMKLDLPEPRLNNMYRNVLVQMLINAEGDFMPYGSEPGSYDGHCYGVEEGYCMTALAACGLLKDAQRYISHTYLTPEFLAKVEDYKKGGSPHQQYRNGLTAMYAINIFRLGQDRDWLNRHLGQLTECADWTIASRRKTMKLENGKKPLHWGLLPEWAYGGDIGGLLSYAVYGNMACWRGLQDTAALMRELGDNERAQHYQKEADDYLAVLNDVLDRIYRPQDKPPFLPLRLYYTRPIKDEYISPESDFYQLFAGMVLDLQPFDFKGRRTNYITDYLEQDNRLFCFMPRFRNAVGPGGLDAIYGLGLYLTKLHQDRIKEFLLAFYAYQVFNMEQTCFTSREVNAVYSSDLHLRTYFPFMQDPTSDSSPLPSASAVAAILLRNLLVTEEPEKAGGYSGNLLLLYGAPRDWFRPGQTISVQDAPSYFGRLSYRVAADSEGTIRAEITPPDRGAPKLIRLRLRHPDGHRLDKVTLNGAPWTDFDPERELINLPCEGKPLKVEAHFGEGR